MKFTVAAVLAAATGAFAGATNLTYTTEVVDVYTTYCPAPTQITIGSKTWTVTEATTLTITDCSCTVTKPIYTTSSVICNTCAPTTAPATAPAAPTYTAPPAPVYNTTVPTVAPPAPTYTAPGAPAPTASVPASVPTAGAGKVAFISGAGLAGLVGLAAFAL